MKRVIAMLLVFGTGAAMASGGPSEQVVRLAATMNETALACKHMSSAEVQQAMAKQKAAALTDMKIPESDYNKLYEASAKDFKAKWTSMSKAQQASVCDQMKKMAK